MDTTILKTPLATFIIRGIALFFFWDLVFYPYIIPASFHAYLIAHLLDFSEAILNALHLDAEVHNATLFLGGIRTVNVGVPCDGIETMGIFSCVVIAFRSKWIHKGWMILTGIAVIFLLNTIRIVALAWLFAAQQIAAFNINHKYLFNIALYALLLIMLYLWSSRFAEKMDNRQTV